MTAQDDRHAHRSWLDTAKAYYRKIPPGLRCVTCLPSLLVGLVRHLRLELWRIDGEEASGGGPLSVLVAVSPSKVRSKNYLLSLGLKETFREKRLAKVWLWNVSHAIATHNQGCDLVFVVVDRAYLFLLRARAAFPIPAWVLGEVDLPYEAAIRKSDSNKTDRSRIRKNALTYEVTRDPARFDEFYYHMYVPHITVAHGDTADITSHDKMRRLFDHGELLLVLKDGKAIAGILLGRGRKKARLRSLGILDGNRDYLNYGTMGALYHFALRYLGDQGVPKATLGWSRAFLRDGVLHFKNRRCLQRLVDTSPGRLSLEVLSNTPAARAFLQNNPFIFEKQGKIHGAVFADAATPPSPQEVERLEESYFLSGMSKLFIFVLGSGRITSPERIPEGSDERVILVQPGEEAS